MKKSFALLISLMSSTALAQNFGPGPVPSPWYICGSGLCTNGITLSGLLKMNGAGATTSVGLPITVPNGGTGGTTFTPGLPLLGGSSSFSQGTISGNTTAFITADSALTNGYCLQGDAFGGVVPASGPCGSGGGGVNSSTPGFIAYYNTSTTVSGSPAVTGVFAAFANTIGTAGSLVINGGVLGTPSSGSAANLTSIPMANATGILAIANGGSGTASPGLVAGTNISISGAWPDQTINSTGGGSGLTVGTTVITGGTNPYILYNNSGILGNLANVPVGNGGTGASSFTSGSPLLGNGSSAFSTGTVSGNTTAFLTADGTLTSGNCLQSDSSHGAVDSGAKCFYGASLTNAVTQCGADNTGSIDSTSELNTCLSTYGTVFLPIGTYYTSSCLSMGNKTALIGADRSNTTINIHSTSANVICPVSPSPAPIITIKNLTLDRTGTPSTNADGIFVVQVARSFIENVRATDQWDGFALNATDYSECHLCVAESNYNNGFSFVGTASYSGMQWVLMNTESQTNNGYGYLINSGGFGGNAAIGGLPWVAIETFANKLGGLAIIGTSGNAINDVFIQSPIFSSDGGGNGEIYANSYGSNIQINGGFIELAGQISTGRGQSTGATSTGCGISLNNNSDVNIVGAMIVHNSNQGICINGPSYEVTISGNKINSNGLSGSGKVGISVANASNNMAVSGNNSYGQLYGYTSISGVTGMISANNFLGNTTAGCSIGGTEVHAGNAGPSC